MGNKGDNLQRRQWEVAVAGNLFDTDQLKPDMWQQLNTGTRGNSYGTGSSAGVKHPSSFEVESDTFIYSSGDTVSCEFLQGCKVFYNHSDWLSVVNCFKCWNICKQKRFISERDPTSGSLWAHIFHSSTNSTDKVSSLNAEISSAFYAALFFINWERKKKKKTKQNTGMLLKSMEFSPLFLLLPYLCFHKVPNISQLKLTC